MRFATIGTAAGIAVALSLLTSACAPTPDGYYDANGTYHPNDAYNAQNHTRPPIPGGTYQQPQTETAYVGDNAYTTTTTTRTYTYDRPGYYDSNGYYIAMGSGPSVPSDLLPPHGMCRVWFTDRPASYQPAIESCDGIQSRVPAGAYVIYGG